MKLFKLTWDIFSGEHGFLKTEVRAFHNLKEAIRFGKEIEYENNNEGFPLVGKLTKAKLEQARRKASFSGVFYKFNGTAEMIAVPGPDGLYHIRLGEKL